MYPMFSLSVSVILADFGGGTVAGLASIEIGTGEFLKLQAQPPRSKTSFKPAPDQLNLKAVPFICPLDNVALHQFGQGLVQVVRWL